MICVDTHAHYYPCYDAEDFLYSVHRNLYANAKLCATNDSIDVVACLLETESNTCFSSLAEGRLGGTKKLSWKVEKNRENPAVLHLTRGARHQLTIIGGRQLVTWEKLELILLGCLEPITNGQAMEDLILTYQNRYGLILPWGFGKWLGKRGKTVSNLLEQKELAFSLGDNAGRPAIWRGIPQFNLARSCGVPIVAGSDPLPLAAEQDVAGSSSICLPGFLSKDRPIEDIIAKIHDQKSWLGVEQRTSSLLRTASNQLAMQIAH